MLKWLVQKMPDPIKNGIGIDNDRHIKIENLTDDPLATLDLRYNDDLSGIRKSLHPSNWLTLGTNSEQFSWKEIYSVNRSNPLYNEDDSIFPNAVRREPTSSVFAVASTQSDNSSTSSIMTNSNTTDVAQLQKENHENSCEKNKPVVTSDKSSNNKSDSRQSSSSGYGSSKPTITNSNDGSNVGRTDIAHEVTNPIVPDSLEPVIKLQQFGAPALHTPTNDVVRSKTREVSPVPAPIWPKYVAKGHVFNAIQKLNRIRPGTPTPLVNSSNEPSIENLQNVELKTYTEFVESIKRIPPPNDSKPNEEIVPLSKDGHEGGNIIHSTLDISEGSGHRKPLFISAAMKERNKNTSTKEQLSTESCIHKNKKYVQNIQIIAFDTHLKSGKIKHKEKDSNKISQETNVKTVLSGIGGSLRNNIDNPAFDTRHRNMTPIKEQPNEDCNSSIPAQMSSSQNDSIVTETLLQLTSFSVNSSNGMDVLYDHVEKNDLEETSEKYNNDSDKDSTISPDGEEGDKKKEDMDKVIQELTKAVMKSKNVTTLTRAMDQRKALFVDSPYLNQRNIGGTKQYLTGKGSTGSTSSSGTSTTCTSTEDAADNTSKRRSRRFKRNSNRTRNSARTIQSLSRGSKGVDMMRNLWLQTGMITNGRKLLIDSLSEDEGSSYGEGKDKNSISSLVGSNGSLTLASHRMMIIENEVRYSEEPTSFQNPAALEKELLKRISSNGSTTTATYAEVYSKSQASSTSPGSSLGYIQSSKTQKVANSNHQMIENDANKIISQSVNLEVDEIRVEEHGESLSSSSSVSGGPNRKQGRKVQFTRDVVANNEEIFTVENYGHIPVQGYSNQNMNNTTFIVNHNEKLGHQYSDPNSNHWFIPNNRELLQGKSDLEAHKELREKSATSASASTSVSPIYNDTNDDKSSSSYKSLFSSPYFDYRKTHSKAGSSIYGCSSNSQSAINIPNSTHLMQRATLLEEQKKRDRRFWKAFSFFLGMTLILGLVVSLTIYFTYDDQT